LHAVPAGVRRARKKHLIIKKRLSILYKKAKKKTEWIEGKKEIKKKKYLFSQYN
jgi:hypothetical protein